jgi:hypothetical protein
VDHRAEPASIAEDMALEDFRAGDGTGDRAVGGDFEFRWKRRAGWGHQRRHAEDFIDHQGPAEYQGARRLLVA